MSCRIDRRGTLYRGTTPFRDGSKATTAVHRTSTTPFFHNKMTDFFFSWENAIFGSGALRSPEIVIEHYIYHLPDRRRPHFDESCRPIDEKTHKIRPFPHLHTQIRPLGPTSPSLGPSMVRMHGYHPKTPYSASPQLGSSSRIG